MRRTPPGVRELKLVLLLPRLHHRLRRTPPGVRELKLYKSLVIPCHKGRTPPGVRELKP